MSVGLHFGIDIKPKELLDRVKDIFLIIRRDAMPRDVEKSGSGAGIIHLLCDLHAVSKHWRVDIADINGRDLCEVAFAITILIHFAVCGLGAGVKIYDLFL